MRIAREEGASLQSRGGLHEWIIDHRFFILPDCGQDSLVRNSRDHVLVLSRLPSSARIEMESAHSDWSFTLSYQIVEVSP
jgi:hypothetical protein